MNDESTKKILSDICWKLEQGEPIEFNSLQSIWQWWEGFKHEREHEKMHLDHAERIRKTRLQQQIDLLKSEQGS